MRRGPICGMIFTILLTLAAPVAPRAEYNSPALEFSEVRRRPRRHDDERREGVATGRSHLKFKAAKAAKREAERIAGGKRRYKVIDKDFERHRGEWICTLHFVY